MRITATGAPRQDPLTKFPVKNYGDNFEEILVDWFATLTAKPLACHLMNHISSRSLPVGEPQVSGKSRDPGAKAHQVFRAL